MKVFTFSFDDCEIYDRRLCALLRQYGLTATFYLISGQLGVKVPFHRYGRDTVVERVHADELPETYRGMEVASHTRSHTLAVPAPAAEAEESLAELSALSGQAVCGLAYPGGRFTPQVIEALRKTSRRYARGASPTYRFDWPEDWFAWQPTCHYADAETPALIEAFLAAPPESGLLLHLFGHSYELTRPDAHWGWAYLEGLLSRLAGRSDAICLTNRQAMRLRSENWTRSRVCLKPAYVI